MHELRLPDVEAVPADDAHVVEGNAEVAERRQGVHIFSPSGLHEAESPPAVRVDGVPLGVSLMGVGEGEVIGLQIEEGKTLYHVGLDVPEGNVSFHVICGKLIYKFCQDCRPEDYLHRHKDGKQ